MTAQWLLSLIAAFAKICELHGQSVKVHVIAHCSGGLSIHMALMGGHLFPVNIASLSCTNSSMYFKLTKLNLVKLTLPLINVRSLHQFQVVKTSN